MEVKGQNDGNNGKDRNYNDYRRICIPYSKHDDGLSQ